MVSKLRKLATGAVATAGLLFCQAALALLTIETTVPVLLSCTDGQACDTNGTVGVPNNIVTWSPVIGGFSVTTFTSFSNNPGSTPFNILDLTWSVAALGASTGGPLTVLASQESFLFPVGPSILQSVCSGDALNSSVICQEWVNLSNTLFGLGPVTPGAQGAPTGFTAPFSSTALSGTYTSTIPNAITDRLIFVIGQNGTSTGDLRSITPAPAIPEPATLVLVGAALAGLGFSRRRKQS